MHEEWKLIDGLKYHEVSSTGKVRSLTHFELEKTGKKRLYKGKTMKPRIVNGYFSVRIKEEGAAYPEVYVHRLVATAFIPNPNKKPEVNHIDNNPSNNNVDNLEWCTHKENMDWMHAQGRAKRTREWIDHLNTGLDFMRKEVVATSIKTGDVLFFKGVNETAKYGFQPSCVSNCINGKRKTHGGYIWQVRAS